MIKNQKQTISLNYAIDLVSIFQRYLNNQYEYDGDEDIFEELPLLDYSLKSKDVTPISIAHNILFYLAYHYHFLALYDDWDWLSCINDFTNYIVPLLRYMDIDIPEEFENKDGKLDEELIYNKKMEMQDTFINGLKKIAHAAFFIVWQSRELCYMLNLKVANEVSKLKKSDYDFLEKDGQFPRVIWPSWFKKLIFERENNRCYYCGKYLDSTEEPEFDHIIPLKEGGTNDVTNIVLSCKECNDTKLISIIALTNQFNWPSINYNDFFIEK